MSTETDFALILDIATLHTNLVDRKEVRLTNGIIEYEFETIEYEVADHIATITFNRPSVMNATNDQFYSEMVPLLKQIANDDRIRCVIITGAGRAFCAGADVKAMDVEMSLLGRRQRHRHILAHFLRPLVHLEKPVIAAVNGAAVGGGFNIALAADIIIASEKAVFSQIFTRLGLVPDLGGLHLLTRLIGLNKAKELCFTARTIDATEAASLGIVNRVVQHSNLMSEAYALAQQIAAGPPTALAIIKSLLNNSSNTTLEQMLEYESYAQTIAFTTDDHKEGVDAFRQKRAPKFSRQA